MSSTIRDRRADEEQIGMENTVARGFTLSHREMHTAPDAHRLRFSNDAENPDENRGRASFAVPLFQAIEQRWRDLLPHIHRYTIIPGRNTDPSALGDTSDPGFQSTNRFSVIRFHPQHFALFEDIERRQQFLGHLRLLFGHRRRICFLDNLNVHGPIPCLDKSRIRHIYPTPSHQTFTVSARECKEVVWSSSDIYGRTKDKLLIVTPLSFVISSCGDFSYPTSCLDAYTTSSDRYSLQPVATI